jgi:uncharacterized protein (DUF58 family)
VTPVHLGQRAYVLIVTAAVLAICSIWSSDQVLAGLWRWPLILLLAGLAYEGWHARKLGLTLRLEAPSRAFLGRVQPAAFVFDNDAPRPLAIEYIPALPRLFDPLPGQREVAVPARGAGRDGITLDPVRLGAASFPALAARVRGALRLAWWSRELPVPGSITVAPDTLRAVRGAPRGGPAGARPRRLSGAGPELHQLRGYVRGDPLGRIDWKATARAGALISRDLSQDQQLDILIALDAGSASRVRAGRLERCALYANVAARFAEIVAPGDDRIGLLVFADRPLAVCAPGRGRPAVARLRRILENMTVQPVQSDPVAAALRIRQLLTHRSLVLLLTDVDDPSRAAVLARAVRLLAPSHLPVLAGARDPEIATLARREAVDARDPWVALAARDHEARTASQLTLLKRLGVPAIAVAPERLEQAVVIEYEALRRSHRV